jgi:hypothetical protein
MVGSPLLIYIIPANFGFAKPEIAQAIAIPEESPLQRTMERLWKGQAIALHARNRAGDFPRSGVWKNPLRCR